MRVTSATLRLVRVRARRLAHFRMSQRAYHLQRLESFLRGRLVEETHLPSKVFRPSLTLSRQYGIDTDRIGQALVEYLDGIDESSVHGWAYFDQALIAQVIEQHRLPPACEPYLAEEAKFPVVDALEQVLGLHPSQWTLFNHTASTIRSLCRLGNAIVAGRGGNYVTADFRNTFHVRLVASEERRIASVRHSRRISHDDAAALVRRTDRARAAYVKRHTGGEIDDPQAYHLTLSAENLSDDIVVRIVGDSLVEWAAEQAQALVIGITPLSP